MVWHDAEMWGQPHHHPHHHNPDQRNKSQSRETKKKKQINLFINEEKNYKLHLAFHLFAVPYVILLV